ncbi:LysE family transporter [Dokdonia sp.]|uniref:LysE family translocator n=1 Tax=Dokdonia sp. TaxID=2024995 RepID=UPI0032658D0B
MTFLLFLIGITATIVGALPPGASNLAVIKTTINEDIKQGLKISYGAGFGEVILAFLALSFGLLIKEYFVMHTWIQIVLIIVLFIVGVYLVQTKPKKVKDPSSFSSKYVTGFLLSIVNPPVLIYWVVVFSMLHKNYNFDSMSTLPVLILFFSGVFLGKVLTLYGYGRLGHLIQNKKSNFKCFINRLIGVILIVISIIQTIKLSLF